MRTNAETGVKKWYGLDTEAQNETGEARLAQSTAVNRACTNDVAAIEYAHALTVVLRMACDSILQTTSFPRAPSKRSTSAKQK